MVSKLRWIVVLCVGLWVGASRAEGTGQSADGDRIELTERHSFSRREARIRIEQLLEYWSSRFGLQRIWDGDTVRVHGTVMGVRFDGVLVVGDHEVSGFTSDPGALLRGPAVDYVQKKLRKYLHPTYSEG